MSFNYSITSGKNIPYTKKENINFTHYGNFIDPFRHVQKRQWTIVAWGFNNIQQLKIESILKEEIWKKLSRLIPVEFRHVIKEEFFITSQSITLTCKYKPLIGSIKW